MMPHLFCHLRATEGPEVTPEVRQIQPIVYHIQHCLFTRCSSLFIRFINVCIPELTLIFFLPDLTLVLAFSFFGFVVVAVGPVAVCIKLTHFSKFEVEVLVMKV